MTKNAKLLLIFGGIATLVLFGRFIYYNIVVPAPFREELKACLLDARSLEIEKEVKAAENTCFRTYPHFL